MSLPGSGDVSEYGTARIRTIGKAVISADIFVVCSGLNRGNRVQRLAVARSLIPELLT
jgi:hypothetical protein